MKTKKYNFNQFSWRMMLNACLGKIKLFNPRSQDFLLQLKASKRGPSANQYKWLVGLYSQYRKSLNDETPIQIDENGFYKLD